MIYMFDYKDRCWWCGDVAKSGEHKFKKSDLVRYFGRGPYHGKKRLVRGFENQLHDLQGPNADEAKFEKNLCFSCNNSRSQPFDRSYDKFMKYIHENEDNILITKRFLFTDIFGIDWRGERIKLIKYFVKHICCRLASASIRIHSDIKAFLDGNTPLNRFHLVFEIQENIVALETSTKEMGLRVGSFWMGDLNYIKSQSTGAIREATSYLGYRWLWLYYLYDEDILLAKDNFSSDEVFLARKN